MMSPERNRKFRTGAACLLLLLALELWPSGHSTAQSVTRISIMNADILRIEKAGGSSVRRLIGNVQLKQDSTWFYCDTAALYDNNFVNAVGNIRIDYSDSVHLSGDYLTYSGDTRIAVLDSNVVLIDPRATLYTDHLEYDRNNGLAYYNTGGRIVDGDNVMTSRIGYYYTRLNEFMFRDSVVAVNPDNRMVADTLRYHTESEFVYIEGPTNIYGKKDHIYSEKGWYDTKTDRSELSRNNAIIHEDQILKADWIYYDQEREYGKATGNVWLKDTVQDVILEGGISEFYRDERPSYITDSARAILIEETDSLFMHADSFLLVLDSADEARYIFAYHQMKFYRKDMQGMCDSLIYRVQDSLISMLGNPVIWSDENQLTSDSVWMHLSKNRVDSMVMFNMAFIISRDTAETFNQIKGKQMRAYFFENKLYRVRVFGNAETVYYVREDNGLLIGINSSLSSDMVIHVNDNKIREIIYLTQPDAVLFPEEQFPSEKKFLKDFKWIEDQRPADKSQIFIWLEEEEKNQEGQPGAEEEPVPGTGGGSED
jgi:lipopolysaccharide export system protein LptA